MKSMDKIKQIITEMRLPLTHKKAIYALGMLVFLLILMTFIKPDALYNLNQRTSLQLNFLSNSSFKNSNQKEKINNSTVEYTVKKGDTLSTIFERLNIGQSEMYQIIEADLNILALDTLRPNDVLNFWIDPKTKHLTKLELYFNLAKQVVFTRVDAEHFEYKEINKVGEWVVKPIGGVIHGSFSVSAIKAGAKPSEVYAIADVLKSKINMRRDLQDGDTFQMVRETQYIDGVLTGNTKIAAVRIFNRGRDITIYQFNNGEYYTADGRNLQRAFARYPTKRRYRISSPFNPHRRHPVTGRISPHNGVDFATPSGVAVYATGDGIVSVVRNHRYAGKYITIQHDEKYRTRYLHLSKYYVRKGQRVKRGQKIGLSGATGRVTGPHLHYEFHINGRARNPLTVKIPTAGGLNKKEKLKFKKVVQKNNKLLDLTLEKRS